KALSLLRKQVERFFCSRKSMPKLKYAIDIDKTVLAQNFESRKWELVENNEDWNFYWASVQNARSFFEAQCKNKLKDDQIVNHFPNSYILTRKDFMSKNIRQYIRYLEKNSNNNREGNILLSNLDIIPTTYILPQDYHLFCDEFKRSSSDTWIMKPVGKAQGKGIFLVNKLSQIKKWSKDIRIGSSTTKTCESYVVSRYIDNPFLFGGKKFDLRLYVLVTSFRPLRAFQYNLGFCRFCSMKYVPAAEDSDNMFLHLTNVAIQKHGDEYNCEHGNKWSVENLRLYLLGTHGEKKTKELFDQMSAIMIHSLRSVAKQMQSDRHCFELYGYDIIIDSKLKPWLVEINASPSMSATTTSDRLLKSRLIRDTINVILPNDDIFVCRPKTGHMPLPSLKTMGDFVLLINDP
ncbi:hypothetical protein SNEBB_007801, partial [Seison nebaliae]